MMQNQTDSSANQANAPAERRFFRKRNLLIAGIALLLVVAGVAVYILMQPNLSDQIVIPFIAHQKPAIDPHLPSTNALADKLDEVQFDGLFNLVANPSGAVYEDGLGELVGIDANNVVTIRLKQGKRWHDSWVVTEKDDEYTVNKSTDHLFSAADLNFTLKRIQSLGSLSPDYILVSQALPLMGFEGPDAGGLIRMQFRGDRIWTEADIKEVLSFKILPDNSPLNALNYRIGTSAYMSLPPKEGVSNYMRKPDGTAAITNVVLAPFIDNSTYATELRNGKINVLLETPFGSRSPILEDSTEFFAKPTISTTFFALFLNTERLNRDQRMQVRNLIDNRAVVDRFFKVGTEQARHIEDYRGNRDNYYDYLNQSVFPSSTYYVEEEVVVPRVTKGPPDLSVLPDTVRVVCCMNYGFREEYAELISILNDPAITRGKIRVLAVTNDVIRQANYDALLVAVPGYRSNFLFDLYDVFLREPDLETYRIHLATEDNNGNPAIGMSSFERGKNFFGLDTRREGERADMEQLLRYVYGFMSTHQIGDKQEYAWRIDELENSMALGVWLFSLPSLAHFSTQFDAGSIDLYGTASQLSTISRWRERREE